MRINWRKFATFLTTVICLVLLIALTVLAITMVKEERELDHIESYQVESGETLWSICSKYRPNNISIQEYLFNVEEYNGIGSMVYAGQTIQVLVYKEG